MSPGISRRSLFGLGLGQLGDDPEPRPREPPPPAPVTASAQFDPDAYEERLRAAWGRSDGSALWADAAGLLIDAAELVPGTRVLDAGAGDGTVALAAVQAWVDVTACDFATELVARGRERAEEEDEQIAWVQADLASLPFADASFDHVLSAFAPMFCLDAPGALSEMLRVVKPGGTVAFTAWTAGGVVGDLLDLAARHDPPPPGTPPPLAYSRPDELRPLLADRCDRLEFRHAALAMSFDSGADATERLLRALGPPAAALQRAGEPVRAGARAIVGGEGAPLELSAHCLLVIAGRRPA